MAWAGKGPAAFNETHSSQAARALYPLIIRNKSAGFRLGGGWPRVGRSEPHPLSARAPGGLAAGEAETR